MHLVLLLAVRASSSALRFRFSFYSPERTETEPGERNGEAYGKQQASRTGSMGLVFAIFAQAGDSSDSGDREEGKSSHFEPELVQHASKRFGDGMDGREQGAPRPAAVQHVGGQVPDRSDFACRFARDH